MENNIKQLYGGLTDPNKQRAVKALAGYFKMSEVSILNNWLRREEPRIPSSKLDGCIMILQSVMKLQIEDHERLIKNQ